MRRHMILEDRYELVDLLSRGGMGEVWRGFDRRLDRPVAIKGIRLDMAASDRVVELFQQEAKIGAKLRHPGLTVIHDLLEYRLDDDFAAREKGLALVMEFLEGEDLGRLLEDRAFSVRETLELGAKILEALRAAHTAGVIHRDVKPSNVMVLPDGRVKICDFGIAKARDSTKGLTADGMLGTYAYIAPERIRREKTDARVDLYSFGIVMYELLRGRPPFEGEPGAVLHAHMEEVPHSLRGPDGVPDLPEELDELVMQLLEKDPSARPPDARTVLRRIRAIERSLPRLLQGRYELVRRLASSGLTDTYLARDVRTHQDVALRLLRSDLLGDPSSHEEFLHELDRDRPDSVAAVTATGESPLTVTLPFAVLDLGRSAPLRERLADGPLPAQEAVRLIDLVLRAIERGHADGLAHPGLGPDTVLLSGDTDRPEVRLLTFAARSPELTRIDGAPAESPEDDLRAVARLLHELLTGSPHAPGAEPSAINPFVPQWCDEIVRTALSPDRPYRSAAEFRRALRERPAHVPVERPAERRPRPPAPLGYLGVGLLIVITLVSTGLLLLTWLRG
ncbi:protein kinase domain-containing protein [Actinocorallia libanotica]|uniref:non-specific serine/threonine protein kinase n=1 Tax=Actinocorallia libanotica TaxID=46162 RepID=A0ABP4BM21_9ACTN